MRKLAFERLCRDLVGLVLASAASAACGGSVEPDLSGGRTPTGKPQTPDTPPAEEEGWTSACADNEIIGLTGFRPEPAVDYLQLRAEGETYDPSAPPGTGEKLFDASKLTVSLNDATGTPCATATDPTRCLASLAAIRAVKVEADCLYGMAGTCYAQYFVYTRGDEVGLVRNDQPSRRGDVLAFFGAIDTPAEAFYLVSMTGGRYGKCYGGDSATYRLRDGAIEIVVVQSGCNEKEKVLTLRIHPDGREELLATKTLETTGACAGRRPDGFRLRDRGPSESAVGDWLALVAELEDAAVHAFEIMAEELREAGAPEDLVARARDARQDEIRHTIRMGELARSRGGRPRAAKVARRQARSLVAMAIENAVEGCVRETYAALVTLFQSERAEDVAVRDAMKEIAKDEIAHAKLSLDVGGWLATRLTAGERGLVAEARRDALATLATEMTAPVDEIVRVRMGLPTPQEAYGLLGATETLAA